MLLVGFLASAGAGCTNGKSFAASDAALSWRVSMARLGAPAGPRAPARAVSSGVDDKPPPPDRVVGANPGRAEGKRWHLDLSFRTSFTKLGGTKQQLDRRLDIPMKADVFGVFSRPTTPLDRKSSLALNALEIGVGRQENDWLAWTWYVAGGVGEDRNSQRWAHLRLKVNFKYGTYLTGFRTEFYPLGRPVYEQATTWLGRFGASRPYLYAGAEGGYVSGEGAGSYSMFLAKVYWDKVTIRDWVLGFPVGAGWRLPLDDHWSINLAGGYTFHVYRPEEYNGWNAVLGVRYRF